MRKRWVKIFAVAALFAALATPGAVAQEPQDKQKPDPQASQNDPRSGAALNREAARNPQPAPSPVFPNRDPKTRVLQKAVNNPAADATAQDTQSETTIAAVGPNVIIGYNDSGSFIGGANQFTGYAHSSTGGAGFADKGALPASSEGDGGDPVLAADQASGAVYVSTLGFSTGENIQVFKSTNGGSTFGAPVNGTPGFAGTGDFQDKEWMTVDNFAGAGQGSVYLCWTRFLAGGGAEIRFTRSTDAGASFGPSSGLLLSGGGQGCHVVVSTDHSVHVFYYRGTGGGGQGGDNKLFARRSTDQGVSFGAEVQVADLLTTTINGNLGLNGGLRSNSFPHAAVNPANGHLYVVYNDNPADADNADAFYVKSTNNGATWSSPAQVNDDDSGREQFFPTIAVSTTGTDLMIGYYSKANDAGNFLFHRQGRLAKVNTGTGVVTFNRSFQLSPDTPIAIGQDPVVNSTYMGDYDHIVATTGAFHSAWSDNRDGNSFHAFQPDVRYARIMAPPPTANLAITLKDSPDPVKVGQNYTVKATIKNNSANATAQDVFAQTGALPAGVTVKSAVASGGGTCDVIDRLLGCYLGTIAPGSSKTIDVVLFASTNGTKTVTFKLTSSSKDNIVGNDSASVSTTVTGTGTTAVYSTGNIAVPIPDLSTIEIPLGVLDEGAALDVDARIRLDHTFDSDLDVYLVSPTGTVVELSTDNGGGGDNFGSGANSCAGTKTVFDDSATTSIAAGSPPFAGSFIPEQSLSVLNSEHTDGEWVLRITDDASADVGTVGCFELVMTRS